MDQAGLRVVVLPDEDDGVTYTLLISEADVETLRRLLRASAGAANLPSIGGSAIRETRGVGLMYESGRSGSCSFFVRAESLARALQGAAGGKE